MAFGKDLSPPPRGIKEWTYQWKDWLYSLYEYIKNMNQDYWILHALNVIADTYGDNVSVDQKNKDLVKFGRTTIQNTGKHTVEVQPNATTFNETFVSSNTIDYIVSTSTGDIAANNRAALKVEGHTVDGSGNFTFVVQDVTLTGQTPAALSTNLARVTRVYNNDSAELQGTISVYDSSATTVSAGGVPATGSGVHLTIRAGSQNSEKCSTTLSSQDYWIVTGVYGDVLSTKTAELIFALEVRAKGKVFREYFEYGAGSGAGAFRTGKPYVIIPPNSDVRVVCYANSATGNPVVSAGVFGALAKVI